MENNIEEIIQGKKTTTFLFKMAGSELEFLKKMIEQEKKQINPQYIVYTTQGKKSMPIALISLARTGEHIIDFLVSIDKQYTDNLEKQFKKGVYTFCEDFIRYLTDYIFKKSDNFIRIATLTSSEIEEKLFIKSGWKKEGTMRKFLKTEDGYIDMTILSILREE